LTPLCTKTYFGFSATFSGYFGAVAVTVAGAGAGAGAV